MNDGISMEEKRFRIDLVNFVAKKGKASRIEISEVMVNPV